MRWEDGRQWQIGKDLEGDGRSLLLRHYPDIRVERPRKTLKTPSQDKYVGFKVLTAVDMESYISEDRTFRDKQ
jgi:hypothetical protein